MAHFTLIAAARYGEIMEKSTFILWMMWILMRLTTSLVCTRMENVRSVATCCICRDQLRKDDDRLASKVCMRYPEMRERRFGKVGKLTA